MKKIVGFYDYTVVLTYAGLFFAYMGILFSINDNYSQAVQCLMYAGICDMFDGSVAATKSRSITEKRFGIQIDSLADLVSFGILPGMLVYKISNESVISCVAAFVLMLSALIRLAFFNVREEERQLLTNDRRESYQGIPVTTIAIILPFFYLIYLHGFLIKTWWFSIVLLIMSVGFIVGIEIKKPHRIGKIILILIGMTEFIGVIIITHAVG